MTELKVASRRVVDAARQLGLDISILTFPEGTRTAADAAAAIGCDLGAIAKSIVLADDEGPLLVLASGRNRVDPAKVEQVLDGGRVRRADADEARAATGYAIGGTAPFGHPGPLRILADTDLLGFETVWAAGGTPDTVFPLTPEELLSSTGATPAEVAE